MFFVLKGIVLGWTEIKRDVLPVGNGLEGRNNIVLHQLFVSTRLKTVGKQSSMFKPTGHQTEGTIVSVV